MRGRFRARVLVTVTRASWTPKVCKIMDFWAIFLGLERLFYILLGSRLSLHLILC